jgi:hypothetical protein
MKRLTLIIIGVLLCTPLYSDMNPYIYGGGVAGAPTGCTGNYGNTNTTDTGYQISTANCLYLAPVTLDCSGTPASINFNIGRIDLDSREFVVCVYSDNGGVPYERLWYGSPVYDAGRYNIGTWAGSISYNFPAPGTYWIGILTEYSGTRWAYSATTGGTLHIFSYGSTFPTPAATLGTAYKTYDYNMTIWLGF